MCVLLIAHPHSVYNVCITDPAYRWYPAERALPPCLRMANRALLAGYPRYRVMLARIWNQCLFTYFQQKILIYSGRVSNSNVLYASLDLRHGYTKLYWKLVTRETKNNPQTIWIPDECGIWVAKFANGFPVISLLITVFAQYHSPLSLILMIVI